MDPDVQREHEAATQLGSSKDSSSGTVQASVFESLTVQRYTYILQQIHTVNENVYRFLAVYQTLATVLAGAAVTLFVNYHRWGISAALAKRGLIALMLIITFAAIFAVLLIVVGIRAWFDYRTEECDLTDDALYVGYRKRPSARNFGQWYETYIIFFIIGSTILMWLLALVVLFPAIK